MRIVYLIAFVFIQAHLFASESYEEKLYTAYLTEDVKTWQQLINAMEADKDMVSDTFRIRLVKARLGLLYLYHRLEDEDMLDQELKKASKELEVLISHDKENALLWAMRTALLGFAIELRPYKVMVYGPRSLDYINKARELNRHLPEVMIEYGNSKYNAPSFAGGDKDLGINQYCDAIAKMVVMEDTYQKDWYFLMVHINYAIMLSEMNRKQEAHDLCKYLLKKEPQLKRVANELLLKLEKEMQNQ